MSLLRSLPAVSLTLACVVGCAEDSTNLPAGARTIQVALSGEDEATEGIAFDPNPAMGAAVFLDGWTLHFDKWLVSVAEVRLNGTGPDPAQQQKVGALVRSARGPWVADLTRPSQGSFTPLITLSEAGDGSAFDTKIRYAFSFDIAPPAGTPQRLNLAAGDDALVARMAQEGLSHYVEGTATHEPDDSAAFKDYPTTVKFQLGWGGHVSYLNCSNPDNGNDEEKNRGVQPRQDGVQRAVLTLHLEHPFWDKLNVENPPLRFDPLAARAQGSPAEVGMDALAGSAITSLSDLAGQGVGDRGQLPGYTRKPGTLSYDPNGTPGIGTLKDFVIYSAQSLAHLNGDGLCYVERR